MICWDVLLRQFFNLKSFSMEINSQLIIDRLSQRMDLDRAYVVNYQFLDQEFHHLVLALKPVSGLSHKVLKPIVELCLMDQENISFELIFSPELKNKIKHGSLFYCYAILPQHEIFSCARSSTLISKRKEIRSILDLSEKYYEKAIAASAEFLQGAQTFAEIANYPRALFMVHQSLESHLKLLQVMVEGKGNNVHSLDSRIRSLHTHFPMFKSFFMGETDEDKMRFAFLDKSFNAVNENRDLDISAVDASHLYDHCIVLQAAIEKLFRYFTEALQTEYDALVTAEAAAQAALEKSKLAKMKEQEQVDVGADFLGFPWPARYQGDVQELLHQIRQENNPEQMMLLNYYVSDAHGKGLFDFPQQNHGKAEVYLVVIKKKLGHCHFRKVAYGQVTAVVAFLNTDFLETKLNQGSRFSHTIWNESVVLYRHSRYKPTYSVVPVDWHSTLFKTSISWTRNSTLMQDLLAVFSFDGLSSPQMAVLFLNQLTSIGLYSYLYLRIGYAPMNVSIADLVDWTCICDKKVKEFFTARSEVEEILNAELLKQMKGRVYELPSQLAQLDMDYFRSKAKEIADFFIDLCDQSIRYMELKSEVKFNKQ